MIEEFFHATDVVVHIELRIFEIIWNGPNGTLMGLGETDSLKNQKYVYVCVKES